MPFGISPQNILKYIGPKLGIVPTVQAPRQPTVNDKNYPLQTLWALDKNPQDGNQGDQWILIKFDTNGDAIWRQLEVSVTPPTSDLNALSADAGTDPVVPDLNGEIAILGTSAQGVSTTGGSNQIAITVANATTSSKGVAQFTAADFSVASGVVSLNATGAGKTLTGNSGGALSPTANNWNIIGASGFTFDGAGSTLTMNPPGSIASAWTEVTGTSQALTPGGWIMNNAALVTGTLPATCAVGDIIRIVGKGAGLFAIAQNDGQTIHTVSGDTTTGAVGSLTAIQQYAAIELVCTVTDTDFTVLSQTGSFTIV